jgi:hypothetical protein
MQQAPHHTTAVSGIVQTKHIPEQIREAETKSTNDNIFWPRSFNNNIS